MFGQEMREFEKLVEATHKSLEEMLPDVRVPSIQNFMRGYLDAKGDFADLLFLLKGMEVGDERFERAS